MKVDCNRIMVQGNRLMIVKDSCLGCKINHGTCVLNDLLESTGFLESWKKWMREAKKMNKQRKVVITITYNEMGIIVDTKTEELGSSAQPEPAIPISWLEKEIECLEKRDGFAKLDAVQLRVLIKRWESEQNENQSN